MDELENCTTNVPPLMLTKTSFRSSTEVTDGLLSAFRGDKNICQDGSLTAILAVLLLCTACIAVRRNVGVVRKQSPRTTCWVACEEWLEEQLVLSWVPSSPEMFVSIVCLVWLGLTIPIGISRHFEKRWSYEVYSPQRALNWIVDWVGCNSLSIDAFPYPLQDPGTMGGSTDAHSAEAQFCRENPLECSPDIDSYFLPHLVCGLTWLALGALQIILARTGWSKNKVVQHRAHRIFGMLVAIPAFLCHMVVAGRTAWRNPLHQVSFIVAMYCAAIVEPIILFVSGIWCARQSNIPKHTVRMFFAWLRSVIGSGSIRLVAWGLWLIGNFVPLKTRLLLDKGTCQAMAIHGYPQWNLAPTHAGSAEHCWKSVFLNLIVTDALVVWLGWIFVCIPAVQCDHDDKTTARVQCYFTAGMLVLFVLLVFVSDRKDDTMSALSDEFIQAVLLGWGTLARLHPMRSTLYDLFEKVARTRSVLATTMIPKKRP